MLLVELQGIQWVEGEPGEGTGGTGRVVSTTRFHSGNTQTARKPLQ